MHDMGNENSLPETNSNQKTPETKPFFLLPAVSGAIQGQFFRKVLFGEYLGISKNIYISKSTYTHISYIYTYTIYSLNSNQCAYDKSSLWYSFFLDSTTVDVNIKNTEMTVMFFGVKVWVTHLGVNS